jgi:CheY-like chemotaxis protein
MDIQMPVMNGLDALIEIRNAGNTIPVIALTANASEKDREKYMEVGFDSVVIKPFRKNELFGEICRLMGKEIVSPADNQFDEIEAINQVLFSFDDLHALVGDDKAFMMDLISTFNENTPRLVGQIKDGVFSGEAEPVKFALHQIKPSLRLFMANELLQMVVEMEELTQQFENVERLKELALELDKKTHLLIQELRIFEATMQ